MKVKTFLAEMASIDGEAALRRIRIFAENASLEEIQSIPRQTYLTLLSKIAHSLPIVADGEALDTFFHAVFRLLKANSNVLISFNSPLILLAYRYYTTLELDTCLKHKKLASSLNKYLDKRRYFPFILAWPCPSLDILFAYLAEQEEDFDALILYLMINGDIDIFSLLIKHKLHRRLSSQALSAALSLEELCDGKKKCRKFFSLHDFSMCFSNKELSSILASDNVDDGLFYTVFIDISFRRSFNVHILLTNFTLSEGKQKKLLLQQDTGLAYIDWCINQMAQKEVTWYRDVFSTASYLEEMDDVCLLKSKNNRIAFPLLMDNVVLRLRYFKLRFDKLMQKQSRTQCELVCAPDKSAKLHRLFASNRNYNDALWQDILAVLYQNKSRRCCSIFSFGEKDALQPLIDEVTNIESARHVVHVIHNRQGGDGHLLRI